VRKPPRWSNEQAVLDLITRWFDEYEYNEVMEQARLDEGRVPTRRELVEMLRSDEEISPQNRARIANLLERDGVSERIEQKRGRGRPPKPIEERRSVSIMPDAKALCLAVIDQLPERKGRRRQGTGDHVDRREDQDVRTSRNRASNGGGTRAN
jgi:hypothetical protein